MMAFLQKYCNFSQLSFPSLIIPLYTGSLEMKKLRQAVLGKNGRNLDDLSHMDGNIEIYGVIIILNPTLF